MSAGVVREHFLEQMFLLMWLGEWVGLDGVRGQGNRVHMCSDWGCGPEGWDLRGFKI